MPIKPTRVTTCGRGSNWGFRVLGPQSEVLAARWRFPSQQAARQAGIAASLAISSTSITKSHRPQPPETCTDQAKWQDLGFRVVEPYPRPV